jgi:hypothetical protein
LLLFDLMGVAWDMAGVACGLNSGFSTTSFTVF